jgi:p-hydroxybenzoate 3-monooxygenase
VTHTQVAIVGAGPAGLMLGRLLERIGIDSVLLESRSREYVEHRVRAGVLEQGTVDALREAGVGDRMEREGLPHHGLQLRFDDRNHRIPLTELAGGRSIVVYGQQEVVKDLIAARRQSGLPLVFEATDVAVDGLDSERPRITYVHDGAQQELTCDFIAGCDGFHGVCRSSIPDGVLRTFTRDYPFAWLGILASVEPSTEELIYACHERGFALHSMRSPTLSRFYLQSAPDADTDDWPDDRIWDELEQRLVDTAVASIRRGPIIEKSIAPVRSFVVEPMRFGRMFLAGDAAHIVPPTGAKGMNLAVADVKVLSGALQGFYERGDATDLDTYSETCLKRVWRAQHFSWWMTSMLHRFPDDDAFAHRLRLAQLRYVCGSRAAATSLAENYVGMEEL